MTDKWKPAVNFTSRERNLLLSIALKYTYILENKQTNVATNSAKNEAWAKITVEFNSTSIDFNNTSMKQLKRLYESRIMLARQKVADVRQKILKPGGGTPPKGDEDELALSTMDHLTFKGKITLLTLDSVTTININHCQ
nr:unnamed protein product [Callosobruchus analis]